MVGLFPMAQGDAPIAHARTNQSIVRVLLECMSDPSSGTTDRENRGRRSDWKAEHPDADRQIKIEIGTQALAFGDRMFNLQRSLIELAPFAPRDRLSGLLEQHRAWITFRINRMTKTRRQTMLAAEHLEALLQPH